MKTQTKSKVLPGYVFPEEFKPMSRNPILELDSYKLSHPGFYPPESSGMHAGIVARTDRDWIVVTGLNQWIKSKFISMRVTMAQVDEAEAFCKAHGEPFYREGWEIVVNEYGGYVPLTIRAVPEGTKVPSGNVVVSIESTDPRIHWMPSNRETSLLRAVWYPSTIATNDLINYRILKLYGNDTCDNLNHVPFGLHDFGGRGVTCGEQAEIGGAAHLIFFMGSDTVEGVRAANYYGKSDMSAFSVQATEHTIQCSWGPTRQREYIEAVIAKLKPGVIISIVIDGYDTIREALTILSDYKDEIRKSGGKLVLRPDSGDPMVLIPQLLKMMAMSFGTYVNTKGYKVIDSEGANHPLGGSIGLLWGDGIDTESMKKILQVVVDAGFASSSIVFGSGGGLLQKVNRDTYKWAQKATAVLVGNVWQPIFKDPVTDPGKKSFAGRKTLVRSRMTGEYMTANVDGPGRDSEWEDVMVTVMDESQPGKLLVDDSLEVVRQRAKS